MTERKSADEARQGRTPHITRYVLAASLALAVVAMLFTFVFNNADDRPAPPPSGEAATTVR
ncbi:hypothetical protein SH611_17150 [Geminicoccaceae bacterium 1502E]|nr:hypothetical protein [Geminicoccaceae bacterium 1502E]